LVDLDQVAENASADRISVNSASDSGPDQQIRSLLLHRVRPASEGGENALLDHEIAYIRLHMRYTARTPSIEWKTDAESQAAVKALEILLASDDPFIYRLTLQSGWGLISNNVLHDRSGFNDDVSQARLLYRLRYFDRISRIDHHCPPLVSHQFRRHETRRGKRLQIIVEPRPFHPIAQVELSLVLLKQRVVPVMDNPDIKLVIIPGVTP
jgi:hypothetical protein